MTWPLKSFFKLFSAFLFPAAYTISAYPPASVAKQLQELCCSWTLLTALIFSNENMAAAQVTFFSWKTEQDAYDLY